MVSRDSVRLPLLSYAGATQTSATCDEGECDDLISSVGEPSAAVAVAATFRTADVAGFSDTATPEREDRHLRGFLNGSPRLSLFWGCGHVVPSKLVYGLLPR